MNFYNLLIDSVKLFYLNVFIYTLFLEAYVFVFILQQKLSNSLPLFDIFYTGVASLIAIVIWINVAMALYRKKKRQTQVLAHSIISEIPFILMLATIWLTMVGENLNVPSLLNPLMLFSAYMLIFPAVMYIAKTHTDHIHNN